MRARLKLYLLPCLLLLCLTLPHLEQGDFRRDTGRYAAVGQYMWSGGHWGVPYLNPETPYFNKPPLALIIHGLFLRLFGTSLAVARLPSILAALGVVVLSMTAVRQIGSRAEAVTSGFILASTYEFFRRSREISLDLWQLLFIMGAVVLILRGLRTARGVWVALAGLPLGFALLCKPLVALLVIPIAAGWCLWCGHARMVWWLLLGTLPIASLVAAPWHWHMYSLFGDSFWRQYFGREVVDRAKGLHLKLPFHYYVVENARTYWPWAAGLVFAVFHRFNQQEHSRPVRRDLIILGLWWVLWMTLFLSVFPDKKPNYALPLYPMLSWVAAAGVCRLPWRRLRAWYESGFRWLAPALTLLLIVLSIAPIRFQRGADPSWRGVLDWISANGVEPRALLQAGLDENEICYFYLKTGAWLGKWRAPSGAGDRGGIAVVIVPAGAKVSGLNDANFKTVNAGSYRILVVGPRPPQ